MLELLSPESRETTLKFDNSNQYSKQEELHDLLISFIPKTLLICPYWINYHLSYGQNLQLILAETIMNLQLGLK